MLKCHPKAKIDIEVLWDPQGGGKANGVCWAFMLRLRPARIDHGNAINAVVRIA